VAVAAFWPGAPARSRPAGTLRPNFVAQELMTTVTVVKRWAEFIYGIRPRLCQPSRSEPVPNPDGSTTQVSTEDDCSRRVLTVYPDQSFRNEIRYPDGLREVVEARTSNFLHPPNLNPQTFEYTDRISNGNHAEYTRTLELFDLGLGSAVILAEHYRGRLTLKGTRIPFTLDRQLDDFAPPTLDKFSAVLPGGARIAAEVSVFFNRTLNLAVPAQGTVTLRGRAMRFQLIATNPDSGQWDRMVVGTPGARGQAANGEFLLGRDFSGRGQMRRGRKLDFVARWNDRATALLILPNGQTTSAGPAGGLIDFLALRWSGLAAEGGPKPGS
jgi:hypothetical protein